MNDRKPSFLPGVHDTLLSIVGLCVCLGPEGCIGVQGGEATPRTAPRSGGPSPTKDGR